MLGRAIGRRLAQAMRGVRGMATKASDTSPCCPPGSEPYLASDYKPKGEVVELEGGLELYTRG